MARHKSRDSSRETVLHRWSSQYFHKRISDRRAPGVILSLVHGTALLLYANTLLHIPQKGLSLLPGGHVLLRQLPLAPDYLGCTGIEKTLHKHVLLGLWQQCCRHCDVEKLDGFSLFGQGHKVSAYAVPRTSSAKIDSLFIHIMPPVTLHCLVHLTPPEVQLARFPSIYAIAQSAPDSALHYSLLGMMAWSSVPYAVWQLSYHFFITVRRREKIAAGRPTSFTWLRRSYAKSWIGRLILGMPEKLQEPAFMLTQYLYALGSMLPCPVWFWYRWPSAIFLLSLFVWSIYNGATYYIDVFGTRFQKELEQMKKDVAKWQTSPDVFSSPLMTPKAEDGSITPQQQRGTDGKSGTSGHERSESSIDRIPMLDAQHEGPSGMERVAVERVRERS